MALTEKAEATRAAILDAARPAFARSGFTATKLRDIAKAVGITQPLIHHYFDTKAELFRAVVQQAVVEYDALQKEQWTREPNDVRFFTEGLRVLFDFVGEQREVLRLARWAQLEDRLPALPGSGEVDAKIFAKFVAAQRAGVLRADVEVDALLLLIDGAIVGFWDRVEGHPNRFADRDRLMEGVIDGLLRAVLSDEGLTRVQELSGAQES
ncbi:MAG: TetR/AcrR family transcriptional regulator [Acidobacteriota bacterium]